MPPPPHTPCAEVTVPLRAHIYPITGTNSDLTEEICYILTPLCQLSEQSGESAVISY